MLPLYQKLVIKIGTNVLSKDDGTLDLQIMKNIVDQIATLKQKNVEIIIITSGAVGSGKAAVKLSDKLNEVVSKQLYAAIGQPVLMKLYSEFFAKYNINCAQILATKSDFCDKIHYTNIQNCFEAANTDNIIPIVNENDTVSVRELMFTDNDELAGLIASMMKSDALVILTNVDGIYDGDPKNANSKVINEIKSENVKNLENCISPEKSRFGRGGMLTKSHVAKKLANLGITTHIINGKSENSIMKVLNNEQIGTKFTPKKSVSSAKRWVAVSTGHEKGIIYINACAEKILKSNEKIASLLPIGITKIEGEFRKGDILKIINDKKEDIGCGMANYDSQTAKLYIGQKNKKELIHYDYLYIEE